MTQADNDDGQGSDQTHNQAQPGAGEEGGSTVDRPEVVSTSDPKVVRGRVLDPGQPVRFDETMVAETSQVTRNRQGSGGEPFVAMGPRAYPEQVGGQSSGRPGARTQPHDAPNESRDHDPHHAPASPIPATRPGWLNLVLTGVVALICGVAGAGAFSYFDASKSKSPTQDSKESGQAKKGSDKSADAEKGGKSAGHAKGQITGGGSSSDSGSEIPGFSSAEDADTLKKQIQNLSSRFDNLQQRLESMVMPHESPPPDLTTMQIKMGDLARSVDDVARLPSQFRRLDTRMERFQEEINGLRDQISSLKERPGGTGDRPTIESVDRRVKALADVNPPPPGSLPASGLGSPDTAMAEGIALFKTGKYPQADDIFRKLQLTRPADACVWYYSALAHGFATGGWDGDTRRFVEQGAERERAGLPSTSQIDTTFAGLSQIQGKDWLSAFRAQLVKR